MSLSDKMINLKDGSGWILDKEDVKEFIKNLKERLREHECLDKQCDWYNDEEIDKLAGEDLI